MNIRSTSHRILRGVLGASGVALVLPACASDRLAEPPPHESGFTGSTSDDPASDGADSSSDGETESPPAEDEPEPVAELCDAGHEAWVQRAIPFIQGRKPESIREVRLLVSAIEQLDELGLPGRRRVAEALAHGPEYLDRWRNYYYSQLRVHRRGDQRNTECYAETTGRDETPDLAESIRRSRAQDPPEFENVTMADVLMSALRLDDITPAYSADLFARMGAPITGGNVTRAEIERTNRAYYGKLFEDVYLGRTTECLQCHTTGWSETDSGDPRFDRHWPVHEGEYFELAVYGEFSKEEPLEEQDVHAVFRHAGFVDYSWCNDDDTDCLLENAEGTPAFGLDFNCGLFRDAYEDPDADLGGAPHMSGPFSDPWEPNLFDLEPRFRDGLDALAAQGVDVSDEGMLADPTVGMAFLFSMNQANAMWSEAMGQPLTVANRFPRNEAQRDVLADLTEAYIGSGYSTRTLVAEVVTHPYFNQAPPDRCGASTPYHLPAIFDPFTTSAADPQERGNGVGDMLHRHSGWVLLESAMRSMWWSRPEPFGPTEAYAALVPFTANTPEYPNTVQAVNPHFPLGESSSFYALCGAGFGLACDDAPHNYEFMRDVGIYINSSEGGFNGVDFNGLLHWEEEVARGRDPELGGGCTGPLGLDCEGEDQGDGDYADALVDAALATPGTLMWDVAVALKDRLLTEPEIASEAEVATIESVMGGSLDETVSVVGRDDALVAIRRYAGVLLNTPQFMLDGVTSAPQDPSADPVLVVPGTSTGELCEHFVGLAAEASGWSTLSVGCTEDGITVE